MTNKEKQYIKELGQLYVLNEDRVTCGGGCGPEYKPVDVIKYIEQQEYNDNLNTYIKYRNNQRYTTYHSCSGGCGGNYNEFRSSSGCGGGCGGNVQSGCGGGC